MKRESWGSRVGFILATSGAAVGLGNIQRFPFLVAESGGGAFVAIYLICVLLVGLPLMLVEFSIGRHAHKNPVASIDAIKPRTPWRIFGGLGILTAFLILTYYPVIAGWTLSFTVSMMMGETPDLHSLASNPWYSLGLMVLFVGITMYVVSHGIRKGIERWSKILLPCLFVLLLVLVIRSLTLPGAMEGVTYYLYPDLSELNAKVFLLALSQAFFSLSVGEGVLVTYGSYATKKANLVSSAGYIALSDTAVALVSGLVIFPAVFAFGKEPQQGIGLTFVVLPEVFQKMVGGQFLGAAFFLLLAFAALTTCIALLEIPVAYLMESHRLHRPQAVRIVGGAAILLGIPSALSHGAVPALSGFYELMDFLWGGLAMVIGGLGLSLFVGRVWGVGNAIAELQRGCEHFTWQGRVWGFLVRYVAPVLILAILFGLFWI